jgi:hypothetical protein
MWLFMDQQVSAPILGRVRFWPLLVALGVAGWCAIYSVALLSWNGVSILAGNTQGGCFAFAMTLAGMEARRQKKDLAAPANALEWAEGISTEFVNQTIAGALKNTGARVETCLALEIELGFGVRAVQAGRTMVFETARWKEPVIDLSHVHSTEENRRKIAADLAVIVGAGTPDKAAQAFVETRPVQFLAGPELRAMLAPEKPAPKKMT